MCDLCWNSNITADLEPQVCQRPNDFLCRDLLFWTLFRLYIKWCGSKLPHNSRTGLTRVRSGVLMCCLPVTTATTRHTMTAILLMCCSKPNYTMINSQDLLTFKTKSSYWAGIQVNHLKRF